MALKPGTHLWLTVNGSNAAANVYGYTVSANAVPVSTATVRRGVGAR